MDGPAQGPFDRATHEAAHDAATGGAKARGRGARKGTGPTRGPVDPAPGLFDGRGADEPPPAHDAEHDASPATQPAAKPSGKRRAKPTAKAGTTEGPANAMQERATGVRTTDATPVRTGDAAGAPRPEAIPGAAWMERMRPYRALRQRELSIGAEILSIERAMGRRQDALGDVIEVWNRIVPPALAGSVAIAGLARGTLTLAVAGSAASYEVGRLLRGGLERTLVAELPGRVRRVKVVHAGADGR